MESFAEASDCVELRTATEVIPVGAVISRPLAAPLCLYRHYGIYVGSGQVVHFNGTRLGDRNARIKLDLLSEFASGQAVRVERSPTSPNHARLICERALLVVECPDNAWNGSYSFLTRNCESFVDFCYGLSGDESRVPKLPGQVQRTANALAVGAIALTFVLRRSSLPVAIGTFAATAAFQWYRSSRMSYAQQEVDRDRCIID